VSQPPRPAGRFAAPSLLALAACLAFSTRAPAAEDPPPRLAFIGLHGGVFEQIEGFAKDFNVRA
jgi:hypothetical protein